MRRHQADTLAPVRGRRFRIYEEAPGFHLGTRNRASIHFPMSIHPEDMSHSHVSISVRVLILNDPAAWKRSTAWWVTRCRRYWRSAWGTASWRLISGCESGATFRHVAYWCVALLGLLTSAVCHPPHRHIVYRCATSPATYCTGAAATGAVIGLGTASWSVQATSRLSLTRHVVYRCSQRHPPHREWMIEDIHCDRVLDIRLGDRKIAALRVEHRAR